MNIYTGTCPACGGFAGVRADGHLFDHKRYADGAGPGPSQSHELVPCEGDLLDVIRGSRPDRDD